MTETRRKFDQDFKEGAVRLAREAGKPIAQVARDLGKRDFPAQKVNTKWYGDGTEISTGEGRLHLDSVLDMASRRVLGFVLGEHHDAALTYGALTMAVAVRGGQVPGHHAHRSGTASTPRAPSRPRVPGWAPGSR
jgi:transposase InsO family protein